MGGLLPRALLPLAPLLLGAATARAAAVSFADAASGLPRSNAGFDCQTINPGGWTGVAFADVDGDGDDDLAAMGRLLEGHHVWLSDGAGAWLESSRGLDLDCHGRSDLDFADWNGDGRPDLGGVGGINGAPIAFAGDGLGGWAQASAGLGAGFGEGFTFGDFNGDGSTDLAIVGHFGGGTRAWLGDGAGNWSERSAGLPPDDGGHRAAAGDFDGDGRDELVSSEFLTGDPARDGAKLWRYDDAAGWSRAGYWTYDQPYGVAVGDANGDGWEDLIVAAAQDRIGTQGSLHVLLNEGGSGSFREASSGLPVMDAYYGDVAAGDLDNDGDLDLVAGDWSGAVRVFLGDGAGNWVEAAATGLPFFGDKIEGLALGDLDGDCRLDIGVAAYRAGATAWRETGGGCPIRAEAGPAQRACGAATFDARGSRACGCAPADIRYRWFLDGALAQDWSARSDFTLAAASPAVLRVDVACATDLTCTGSDSTSLTPAPGAAPPALGNVFRLAKAPPAGVRFTWLDLPGSWGDYQVLALPAAQGPPTQSAFDAGPATVSASAPPGAQEATDPAALPDPAGLVFFRVRGTSACGALPGPA